MIIVNGLNLLMIIAYQSNKNAEPKRRLLNDVNPVAEEHLDNQSNNGSGERSINWRESGFAELFDIAESGRKPVVDIGSIEGCHNCLEDEHSID
jgi:hypothetical protein